MMEKDRRSKTMINFKAINNFIERLSGVRIARSNYLADVRTYQKNSAPLHVEFVGVSGSGKTTLFQEMKRLRGNKSSWLSPKEFKNLLSEGFRTDQLPENYSYILGLKIEDILSRNYRPEDSLSVLCYFKSNLFENYTVARNNQDATVVFEDGLFHNFGQVMLKHKEKDPTLIKTFLKHRIVIYCKADERTIAEHILKRKAKNVIRPQHKHKTIKQLMEQQVAKVEGREKFIAWMKSFRVPVFTINTQNRPTENAHLVMEFINEQRLLKTKL